MKPPAMNPPMKRMTATTAAIAPPADLGLSGLFFLFLLERILFAAHVTGVEEVDALLLVDDVVVLGGAVLVVLGGAVLLVLEESG